MAGHILKVTPEAAKIVFENDEVRVIEITMRKGQKIPMHSHNRGLGFSLNKGRIRVTGKGGASEVVNVKQGEISWSEGESHSVENLGPVLRELSIEFKSEGVRSAKS